MAGRSRLELRGSQAVISAYLIAPVVAISVLLSNEALKGDIDLKLTGADIIDGAVGFLTFWCIAVILELFVVSPLLWGFVRFKWSWLNTWSCALFGFLMGSLLPGLLRLGFVPVSDLAGLLQFFSAIMPWGLAGLTGAVAFRLVAVRTASTVD